MTVGANGGLGAAGDGQTSGLEAGERARRALAQRRALGCLDKLQGDYRMRLTEREGGIERRGLVKLSGALDAPGALLSRSVKQKVVWVVVKGTLGGEMRPGRRSRQVSARFQR